MLLFLVTCGFELIAFVDSGQAARSIIISTAELLLSLFFGHQSGNSILRSLHVSNLVLKKWVVFVFQTNLAVMTDLAL